MPLQSLRLRIGIFALSAVFYVAAFAILSWPWLSGTVTIPWDAKAQFQPELQFLASSLALGESPFWTPNVFAGWPQIADPQSLILSPLHFALAALDATPSFREADFVTFAYLCRRSRAHTVLPRPRLASRRGGDRGVDLRVRRLGVVAPAAH